MRSLFCYELPVNKLLRENKLWQSFFFFSKYVMCIQWCFLLPLYNQHHVKIIILIIWSTWQWVFYCVCVCVHFLCCVGFLSIYSWICGVADTTDWESKFLSTIHNIRTKLYPSLFTILLNKIYLAFECVKPASVELFTILSQSIIIITSF